MLAQRPSKRKADVHQPAASQPLTPKDLDMVPIDGNYVDDDDNVDVHAFINTSACIKDMYMPPKDEEAFRTHGDRLGRRTTVTQRLTFQGFS
jgi:hypothetical protein